MITLGKVTKVTGAILGVAAVATLVGWKVDRPAWASEVKELSRELVGYRKLIRKTDCRLIAIQISQAEDRHERYMTRYRDMRAAGRTPPPSLSGNINRMTRKIRRLENQQRKNC